MLHVQTPTSVVMSALTSKPTKTIVVDATKNAKTRIHAVMELVWIHKPTPKTVVRVEQRVLGRLAKPVCVNVTKAKRHAVEHALT